MGFLSQTLLCAATAVTAGGSSLFIETKALNDLADSPLSLHIALDKPLKSQIAPVEVLEVSQTVLDACKRLTALLFRAFNELEDSLVLLLGPLGQLWCRWTGLILALFRHSWLETFHQLNYLVQLGLIFGLLCLIRSRFLIIEHKSIVSELFCALGIGLLQDVSRVEHTPSVVNTSTVVFNGTAGIVLLHGFLLLLCKGSILATERCFREGLESL